MILFICLCLECHQKTKFGFYLYTKKNHATVLCNDAILDMGVQATEYRQGGSLQDPI